MNNGYQACPEIKLILELEFAMGNNIKEISTGWSKVKQVFHMALPMSEVTRKEFVVKNEGQTLKYWESLDPHYPFQSGIKCQAHMEAIVFPLPKELLK